MNRPLAHSWTLSRLGILIPLAATVLLTVGAPCQARQTPGSRGGSDGAATPTPEPAATQPQTNATSKRATGGGSAAVLVIVFAAAAARRRKQREAEAAGKST